MSVTDISDLPDEVILIVFEFLDCNSLANSLAVSKRWNFLIATNDNLWRGPTLLKIRNFSLAKPAKVDEVDTKYRFTRSIRCWKAAMYEAVVWLDKFAAALDAGDCGMEEEEQMATVCVDPLARLPSGRARIFISAVPYNSSVHEPPDSYISKNELIILDNGQRMQYFLEEILEDCSRSFSSSTVQLSRDDSSSSSVTTLMQVDEEKAFLTKWLESATPAYKTNVWGPSNAPLLEKNTPTMAFNECVVSTISTEDNWRGGYISLWDKGRFLARFQAMEDTHCGALSGNLYICCFGWWISSEYDQSTIRLWQLYDEKDDIPGLTPVIKWEVKSSGLVKAVAVSAKFCACVVEVYDDENDPDHEKPNIQLELRSSSDGSILGTLSEIETEYELFSGFLKVHFTPVFMILQLTDEIWFVDLTAPLKGENLCIVQKLRLPNSDIEPFHCFTHQNQPIIACTSNREPNKLFLVDVLNSRLQKFRIGENVGEIFDFGVWIIYQEEEGGQLRVCWRAGTLESGQDIQNFI